MSKLYALTILFLAQSVCAMENEQPKPRVFSFFNGGKPVRSNDFRDVVVDAACQRGLLTNDQASDLKAMDLADRKNKYVEFRVETWKKELFDWTLDLEGRQGRWTPAAKEAFAARKKEIIDSARAYELWLHTSKPWAANALSYVAIDPLFQVIADKIPSIADKSAITVKDLSVPVAAFLVGAGIEYADLTLGHALFNKNMQRGEDFILYAGDSTVDDKDGVPCLVDDIDDFDTKEKEAKLRVAFKEGIKDFKAAAIVSVLRIVADQGMYYTGGYEKLEKIKNNLKQKNPELYEVISIYSKIMSYGVRSVAQPILGNMIFNSGRHANLYCSTHFKYLNQPNCPS